MAGARVEHMTNFPGLFRAKIARLELCLNEMKLAVGLMPPSDARSESFHIDVGHVLRVLAARRIRVQQLGADLVTDPAWDLLLQAFAADLAETSISASDLCRGTPVPETTTMRWMKKLEEDGWFQRSDPRNGESHEIRLTSEGSTRLRHYFEAVGPVALHV